MTVFKPEDFNSAQWKHEAQDAARIANRVLSERGRFFTHEEIEAMPKVMGRICSDNEYHCHTSPVLPSTFSARLLDIQPIKKECPGHEPTTAFTTDQKLEHGGYFHAACRHCGVKLKAKWEASE